jgi:phosphoserine phosphatase
MMVKLIFFDMEGTIFKKSYKDSKGNTAPSAWTLVAQHLGKEAFEEEESTKNKWNSKGYAGYVEWMEDTIRIHKKYGLTKDFFDKVMSSIQYYKGVRYVFKEIQKRKIRTAIISGGFKAQADRALRDLKINHAFAACEYLWDKNGRLVHWNLLPCDFEGKLDFMKLIMKEHGLKDKDCAFVGDGRNDIPLARAVSISVAFNAAPELKKVSTHSVESDDFQDLLKYLIASER